MATIPKGVGDQSGDRQPSADPVVQMLRISEAAVATARNFLDSALCRVQLRLHAWQVERDATTRPWIEGALRWAKDGTAAANASTREDILEAIEKSAGQR